MKVTKNILVYADGHIEVLKQALEGMYFIKMEDVDGALWERTFEVDFAKDTSVLDGMVVYGREKSFEMKVTAEERARREAERRDRVMRECLWGIANYPGDDVADKETR
jgi:hypothetical protein